MKQQLELSNRAFIQDRASRRLLLGSMLLMFVILPLIILAIVIRPQDTDFLARAGAALGQHIAAAFRDEPLESSFTALVFLGVPVMLLYMELASRHERLVLTQAGIRYVSPLPEPLQFLYPGWFIRWGEVVHARLERPRFGIDPALSTLTLATHAGERRLRPYVWVDAATWKPVIKRRFGLPVAPAVGERLDSIINSALVNYVRAHVSGMEDNIEAGAAGAGAFRLENNPWSGGMTIALLVLLGYALVDTFIVKTEVFAGPPPVAIYALTGLLVFALAAFQLFRVSLPRYVCILLPALLGLAVVAASHPLLLRINQLTDASGLASYTYVRGLDGQYLPLEPGTPLLSMDYPPEYWAQFQEGSTHEFELRRGGLGFWQLSEVSLRESYLDYFDSLRPSRNSR